MRGIRRTAASLVGAGFALLPSALHAQEAAGDVSQEVGVGEIVVTAQRREQSVQDVPVAVTAFSQQDMVEANIQNVSDYFQSTPNVFISDSPIRSGDNVTGSALGLALRGISNIGGNASSFGIYLDEFNISNIALNPHLLDLERIEVLRGPQGTYFGRNASGGVMSLSTHKPELGKFGGFAEAAYGRFDSIELNGAVNVPLGDVAALRVAGKWERSDGEFINAFKPGTGNGRDYKVARAALRIKPTDQLTVDLSYSYTDEHDDDFGLIATGVTSGFIQSICPGVTFSCPVDAGLGFYPDNRRRYSHDAPLEVDNRYHLAVGRIDWHDDTIGITSITGYGHATFHRAGELDFSSKDFLREGFNDNTRSSFSQELRFRSANDAAPFQWIVGGVYAHDKVSEGELIAIGAENDLGLPAGFRIELGHSRQSITTTAMFAEASYRFSPAFSVTVGARYSQDRIDRWEDQLEFEGPVQEVAGRRSFEDISPRIVLRYEPNEALNFYASAAKGWKAGGFQLDPQRQRSDFGDETLWSYEVGLKSKWLDNRLRANLALFYIDWRDVQVSTSVIGVDNHGQIINFAGISNAASASSKGVELELLAAPVAGLELGFNLGYLDAKFDSFAKAVTNYGTLDLSGAPLPKSPEWTVSAFGQYTVPLGGQLSGFLRGEYYHASSAFNNVNNIAAIESGRPAFPFLLPGYDKVNLRVGLQTGSVRIMAFVDNLFDAKYYTSTFDFGFANGASVVPSLRRWGVRVRFDF